ncbi:MAG: histidine kinase [Bacteroidales bacterium]|nr:histidine kinase [Bacteroidales bacterium]
MKPSFKLACILLLVAGSYVGLAQTSETSSGKCYLFKHYTTQNGLPANDTYAMAQDGDGYIWIASSVGLSRFDGKTFYHKAVPEIYDNAALVAYIGTTPDGAIIPASYMQGVFVQQDDGRFKQFLEGERVEVGKNMFKVVKSFQDNSILACTGRSLYLIDEDSINHLYTYDKAMTLFSALDVDKENRIWFGGRLGLGMMQLSDTAGYEPLFFSELKDKFICDLLFDDEGTLHIATVQGYYRITWRQPSHWDSDYTIEQPFPQLKDIYINHLYLDNERHLWIPTDSYGVFRTKGDAITLHLTQENGLTSSSVICTIQDHEGNFWFGTNNGVSMVKDFDDFAIANNGVLFSGVSSLAADAFQRIWMHSRSDLFLYQNDELIPLSLRGTPIEIAGIRSLEINYSEVLISNDVGLFRLPISKSLPDMRKIEKVADYSKYKVPGLLHAIATDSEGVWICSATKLCNYYSQQFLPVTFNHADSVSLSPRRMICDKYGYYWCGDYSFGIFRGTISRPDNNKILFDPVTTYKSRNADSTFVSALIREMTFDKEGNLWYSSLYTGVYKLTIDADSVLSYKLYSTADGLVSNNVYGITFDDEGSVWFLTPRGISILRHDSNGTETIHKFDVNPRMEGITSTPLQIADRLYLLTDDGVFVTQNQLLKGKSESAPNVLITNVLINGVADPNISARTRDIRLAHGQNNITIEYSAITFRNADNVRYQYKLEGADNDWSVLSERGFVEYAALRPGNYTFKVRAAMAESDAAAGEETSLSFRIRPAYYQTVWFYTLIVVFIFALLYAFYTYRLRQVIKMERIRTRIASDLHDDIGSTLSSISMLSEMASRQDKEAELVKALSKIGVDSRDILNSMDDIIWSVNPQNDSLSSLVVRLREYAIPMCETKDITFDLSADESIFALKLGMEERRNIFLIVKEAVNNAIKHSDCKNLSVAFLKTPELEISIHDDGNGFDVAAPTSRNGVSNMKRRATQIGGELTVISEMEKGTTIVLKTKV